MKWYSNNWDLNCHGHLVMNFVNAMLFPTFNFFFLNQKWIFCLLIFGGEMYLVCYKWTKGGESEVYLLRINFCLLLTILMNYFPQSEVSREFLYPKHYFFLFILCCVYPELFLHSSLLLPKKRKPDCYMVVWPIVTT